MTIRESELRTRLSSDDDDEVAAALHDHFEAVPDRRPLQYRWCVRPNIVIEPDEPAAEGNESWFEELSDRVLDWANGAQRLLRQRRFDRLRQSNPHWPVVICEGDSWVAHPLVDDITDHLLDDDRYAYAVLGVGAADDLLADIKIERDHERAVDAHDARALVLSGGGNDLLVPFSDFLRLWTPGAGVDEIVDLAAVDRHMHQLMSTMQALLMGVRTRMPSLPIIVHGYDYLRVEGSGKGKFLGPLCDEAGIDSLDLRRAALRAIVDRYNEHVQQAVACISDVTYLDLRGVVPDDEWYDEIHPSGDGFSRIGAMFGRCLDDRLG